jgi:beta-lactamase regulating signal transducer with metallopeptidase domain
MSFEFLIEMAWKSALIAGVALGLAAILRSRAAADRAAVLRVAVTLLLLLPLFSLGLPKLEIEAWAPEAVAIPSDLTPLAMPTGEVAAMSEVVAPLPEPTIWDDPSLLFLILYLGGVAMAAARLGAGLWTLKRWTAGAREVECPIWSEAFERARWAAQAPGNLRLLVSDEAPSPLSWGLLRPVILVDRDTLDEPEDADAILAHEIAHVVRRDWAVLMLTRTAAALFWFNPLVWLLEREVVQQAEEAADIEAALWVEPARYAQTLVHWAQFNAGGMVPANSIAPSATALARRVRAILDARRRSTPSGAPVTFAAIAASALFAVTLAVLQLIPAVAEAHDVAAAPPAPATLPATAALAAPAAIPMAVDAPLVVTGAASAVPAAAALAAAHPHPEAAVAPPAWPTPPTIAVDVRVPRVDVRVPRVSVDIPRIEVRVPRVDVARAVAIATAQAATARQSAVSARVEVDQLVQMRVHGVNAAYIRGLAEANSRLRRLNTDQLVAMRIHGVSPEYVRSMAAAGYPDLSAESLVAMRIHGVSAADARRAASARGRRPSPEELIDRAIHGGDDDHE